MDETKTDNNKGQCFICNSSFVIKISDITEEGIYICSKHAVELFNSIKQYQNIKNIFHKTIEDKEKQSLSVRSLNMKPKRIYYMLNDYVVGQETAKKVLSIAISNHCSRIKLKEKNDKRWQDVNREVLLFIGPSGCGKTHICNVISKNILNVPMWKESMTRYTEEGYIGKSVNDLISSLIRISSNNIKLAEYGVMFLDEIDKKARPREERGRDVSGEGVQISILDWIDTHGSEVIMNMKDPVKGSNVEIKFNTANVLFILGGAFEGMIDIISSRKKKTRIGFNYQYERPRVEDLKYKYELLQDITEDDLIQYGMVPELVGRISNIIPFEMLSKEQLKDILVGTKEPIINKYITMADIHGFTLEFSDDAIDEICDIAYNSGLGARNLFSIVNKATREVFFNMSTVNRTRRNRVVITKETIRDPSAYEVV